MSSAPLVGVCLGTMEFGRYSTEAQAQRMVSSFLAAGFTEADTASMYVDGESERILGRLPSSLTSRLVVHTKANPWFTDAERKGLTRTSVLNQGHQSLASLKLTPSLSSPPLDIFYLHAPDHSTPIMDTLSAVHALHQEGAFRRFGLSNYSSWQVMEIHHLCTQRGIIRPTVYQGMYNALTRAVESELFPCLRHLGMSYYAYNPLAGGILSGRHQFDAPPTEPGRYAGNAWAERYKERFWKRSIFDAIDSIQATLKEVSPMTMTEASLRWMRHHSGMSGGRGDCIIIGASKEEHVEANLKAVQGGPLDSQVVEAFDRAWGECKADCPAYFR